MGYKSRSLGTAPWPRATQPARHHAGVRGHSTRVTPTLPARVFQICHKPKAKLDPRQTAFVILLQDTRYDNVPLHDTLDLQFHLNHCSPSQIL